MLYAKVLRNLLLFTHCISTHNVRTRPRSCKRSFYPMVSSITNKNPVKILFYWIQVNNSLPWLCNYRILKSVLRTNLDHMLLFSQLPRDHQCAIYVGKIHLWKSAGTRLFLQGFSGKHFPPLTGALVFAAPTLNK